MNRTFILLLGFGVSPVLIFIGGIYAYKGVAEGKTLGIGLLGVQTGLMARLHGVLYGLFGILGLAAFVFSVAGLLRAGLAEVVGAIVAPLPVSPNYPTANIVFVGLGAVILVMGYWITKIKILATDSARQWYVRRRLYLMAAIFILAGFSLVPGVPAGCLLLLILAAFYLDPALNPRNAMRFGV